jgi:hypothetical protein
MTDMENLLFRPLLRPLWDLFPHLPPLLLAWDNSTLGEIATGFTTILGPSTSRNGHDQVQAAVSPALLRVVEAMAESTLGRDLATSLTRRLQSCPSVLSANYHGVECFPEMVQALHFFALPDLLSPPAPSVTVLPVVSCGSVSLQSPTYPRGLMLSRRKAGGHVRLPFFPSSCQDLMACRAPALNPESIRAMRRQWSRSDHGLLNWEQDAVNEIMDTHVARPEIMELRNFSQQVAPINASLCRCRYPDAPRVRVIYLEMETLAASLISDDLDNGESVMHRILFDPAVRTRILERLAGVRGCWKTLAVNGPALGRTGNAGTVFFWLADERGRRCPVRLVAEGNDHPRLVYQGTSIALRPTDIQRALGAGQLIPSLFSAYVSLTLDHGLRCFGGIFLADYLPAMINGVRSACDEAQSPVPAWQGYNPLAALPISVQVMTEDGQFPAGGVELMASGGLGQDRLRAVAGLTLADVLPASLASWYEEYVPAQARPTGWETELAELAARWQGVVVEPRPTRCRQNTAS